jgi:hypothetical protein
LAGRLFEVTSESTHSAGEQEVLAPDEANGIGPATHRGSSLISSIHAQVRDVLGRARYLIHYFAELRWIVLIGILVRVCLWVYSSQADLSGFASMSVTMAYGGGPYTFGNNYPPAWPLLLNLVGRGMAIWIPPSGFLQATPLNAILVGRIGILEPPALVTPAFSVAEKTLLLPFDLGAGLIIYCLARSFDSSHLSPRVAFAVWFLNPLVITVSSVHGNYDVISTFFVLLSLLMLKKGDQLFAGISAGIAITLELYPIFLVPLFVAIIVRGKRRVVAFRQCVWFMMGGAISGLVLLWPPDLLSQFLVNFSAGPRVGNQFGGFWVWSITTLPGPGIQTLSDTLTADSIIVSLACVAIATVSVVYLAFAWITVSRFRCESAALYFTALASIFAIYFSLPIVQPQNLIWALPFLLLGCLGTKSLRIPFAVASTIPVAFYFVGLGGPLYLFQGLSTFTSLVAPSTVISSVTQFASYHDVFFPVLLVSTFVILALALIETLQLGRAEIVAA